jgi:hypothetical protein
MVTARHLYLLFVLWLGSAACKDEDDLKMCVALTSDRVRAPAGDTLCASAESCSTTAGQPDHQGCPNTCSCLCHDGLCYENTCTALACSDAPVFR